MKGTLATLLVLALVAGQAQAAVIFGGDFQLYVTGTAYTVTAELSGPGAFDSYAQGVGDGVPLAGSTAEAYGSDGSTNKFVDLPGWKSVHGGNPDSGKNGVGDTTGLNIFASWGGRQRVETTSPVGTIEPGMAYTISAMVDGPAGGPIEGDVAFHLLANGTPLTPVAELPTLTGGLGFQQISKTYDTTSTAGHTGESLTIVIGVEDSNGNGNRMIWDDVSLDVQVAGTQVAVPNAGFEERENFDAFPESTDKYLQWARETWRHLDVDNNGGPVRIWNPGDEGDTNNLTPQGHHDVGFGGLAPEGKYVATVRTRYNDNEFYLPPNTNRDFEAVAQILPSVLFDASSTYTLSATVGAPPGSINYSNMPYYGYAIQIAVGGQTVDGSQYAGRVEGGTVIAQDWNSVPVATNTYEQVLVTYTPDPADAYMNGLPMQIRLCSLENPADHSEDHLAVFDDVSFYVAPGPAPVEPLQFVADFEPPAYEGSADGTLLTGQQGWYHPAGDSAQVYTYDTNTLPIDAVNPVGGLQFGAGLRTTGTYVRAQHDFDLGDAAMSTVTRFAYDFNCDNVGTNVPPTPARWIASISLQPSSSSQGINSMREWTTNAVNPTYHILYSVYTNPASPTTSSYTPVIFDELPVNHWYREEIAVDFAEHRIVEVALTDLETSTRTVVTAPTNWYVRGSMDSTLPLPTALRFFTGSPDNMIAYDNFTINAGDVGNSPATDIATSSATLNGYVQWTGTVSQATVYWGPTDGGTDPGAWSNSTAFGTQPAGYIPLSTNITGLSTNTMYFYRFYASDGGASAWADESAYFVTREYDNFYEDFEPYANGSQIGYQGNWIYWADDTNDLSNGGAFVTNTPILSGDRSLEVGAIGGLGSGTNSDVCWQFDPPPSDGTWTFRALVYVPSTSTNGTHWINWMASHPTTPDWAADLALRLDTGLVDNGPVEIVRDQWVEVRAEIRIDQLEYDLYYNNEPVEINGTWDGPNQIQAIDLWVGNGGAGAAPIYFDDLSMERMYIINSGATDLTAVGATLHGELLNTSYATDVTVYWGLTDGGTDPQAWEDSASLGMQSVGPVSAVVSNLVGGGTYYYRFFASSLSWDEWAHTSDTFQTLSTPEVENNAPSLMSDGTARLRGAFANQNRGDVTLYWGLSDGGTDPLAWENSASIGTQPNASFYAEVSGLLFPNTYYYTCYATNAYGDGWAPSSTNFVTLGPVPANPSGSLNYAYYEDAANTELAAIDDGVNNGQNGGLFALTPTPEASWPAAVQGKSSWTTEVWQGGNMGDTYCQMWWGYFLPPTTGTYTFDISGDDYEILWIDTNLDDEFQAATDLISDNTPPEGWNTPHTETVDLESGLPYAIAIAHNEGGGGDWFNMTITAPGGSALRVDPSSPAQTDWWWDSPYVLFSTVDIVNDAPTDVSTNSATLNGTLNSTASIYDVTVYWGPTDESTNTGSWANSAFLGTYTSATDVALSHPVTGLTPGSTNYYTFGASNALYGVVATPSAMYLTVSGPPTVTNFPATVAAGEATLSGELTAGGLAETYICWGETDGGTGVPADWDNAIPLGLISEGVTFNETITGIYYGLSYGYRVYATNVAGTSWSPLEAFAPLAPQEAGDPTPGADFFTDAGQDEDGDQYWEDLTPGNPTGSDLLLDDAPAITRVPVTTSTMLTHAYDFPGGQPPTGNEAGALLVARGTTTQRSFGESNDGNWDTQPVTLEIWLRPDTLTPAAANGMLIFEDGGGTGMGILIDDNELYVTHDNGSPQIRYNISTDPQGVLTAPATTDFMQVVVTHDTASPFQTVLYVNGQSVGTTNDDGDWSGGDAAGFGTKGDNNVGGLGSGDQNTYTFDGHMAVIRGYRDQILTPEEVLANYEALALPTMGISNGDAVNITSTSADLAGTLEGTQAVFTVTAYWGTNDNADASAWLADGTASSALVGTYTNMGGMPITQPVTSLDVGTIYYFTFVASNAVTNLWASPNGSFTTVGTPAIALVGLPSNVFSESATVEGELTAGTLADATLVWGTYDGGTNDLGVWQQDQSFGSVVVGQLLTANLTNLTADTDYFYRYYATNEVGDAWSSAGSFTTQPALEGELGILKPWANGGINPATGAPWAAGDTYRLVFASRDTIRDATSHNMQDYHDAVTAYANAAGLAGTWFCIGMTSNTTGQVNTQTTDNPGVGIFRTDGVTKVADSYTDFWDGSLDAPMSVDEYGVEQTDRSPNVGGYANGNPEPAGGRHLGGSTETPSRVHHGRSTDTGGAWARVYNRLTTAQARYYAMSDVLTMQGPPTAPGMFLIVR